MQSDLLHLGWPRRRFRRTTLGVPRAAKFVFSRDVCQGRRIEWTAPHAPMKGSSQASRTTRPARHAGRLEAARLGPREVVLSRGQHGEAGPLSRTAALERAGFRFGARGTQSSRSIMLREVGELLRALPPEASRADYTAAIVDDNVLAKPTGAARRATRQRLAELYALDPAVPLFRVLRRLWVLDRRSAHGRPLLALLTALARDPLLRLTAAHVLALAPGKELVRADFAAAIRVATGPRFNNAVLSRVAYNAASSWSQAGHLDGRRVRCAVRPTPASVAMALWLGETEGLAGLPMIDSWWAAVLDLSGGKMLPHAMEAARLGLIRLRAAGNVVEVSARTLDTGPWPTPGLPSRQKSYATSNLETAP